LIQNPGAIGRIVDDLRRAVELAAPYSKSKTDLRHLEASEAHRTMSDSGAMLNPASGYLQEIDHRAGVCTSVADIEADHKEGWIHCILWGWPNLYDFFMAPL
jgi:hypothetical protein